MPEHANIEAVRHGYEAFNKGDMDTLADLFAEDVVWHVPGRSAIAGDYRGRDATFAYFARLDELTGSTYQAEPLVVVGDEEHVVTIDQSSATREDRSYDQNEIVVCRFRDGRVVEGWQALMNQYAHDEFFA